MNIKNLVLTAACLLAVAACSKPSSFQSGAEYGFALDWNEISYKNDEAKKSALKKEQFKLNLLRVTDLRGPEARSPLEKNGMIYEYRPNQLVNGMEDYVFSSMNKYMRYSKDASVQLGLEVNIKRFETSIEHVFLNRLGEYRVNVELEFLVRDEDSRIIMREIVAVDDSKNRYPVKGSIPSSKRDRKEMKSLAKKVMADITLDMGWMVHNAFNKQRKYYHPLKEVTDWSAE